MATPANHLWNTWRRAEEGVDRVDRDVRAFECRKTGGRCLCRKANGTRSREGAEVHGYVEEEVQASETCQEKRMKKAIAPKVAFR